MVDATQLDFSADARTIQKALAELVARRGPFDTLVHGVGAIDVRRFERFTMDDYDEAFNANVRSAVLAIAAVLPGMRAQRFGRIIVFGGNGSSVTAAHPGMTLHQAAKSALVAFREDACARRGAARNHRQRDRDRRHPRQGAGRTQALESAAGNPRGRPGSVDDVSDVVRFLVAPERDFITGAVIGVTGGLTAADERNAHRS